MKVELQMTAYRNRRVIVGLTAEELAQITKGLPVRQTIHDDFMEADFIVLLETPEVTT